MASDLAFAAAAAAAVVVAGVGGSEWEASHLRQAQLVAAVSETAEAALEGEVAARSGACLEIAVAEHLASGQMVPVVEAAVVAEVVAAVWIELA